MYGCFSRFGAVFGLVLGAAFTYKYFTDDDFANTIGIIGLILFGLMIGMVSVVAVLLTIRQMTGIVRINAGPGATNYRFNVQQPGLSPGYPPQAGQLPPPTQMTVYPPMPEMPEMPARNDDDDYYSPVA
jgi:hypothetical protein